MGSVEIHTDLHTEKVVARKKNSVVTFRADSNHQPVSLVDIIGKVIACGCVYFTTGEFLQDVDGKYITGRSDLRIITYKTLSRHGSKIYELAQ